MSEALRALGVPAEPPCAQHAAIADHTMRIDVQALARSPRARRRDRDRRR
jgi:hypothetical protein